MDKIILYKEGIDMKVVLKPYSYDEYTKEDVPNIVYHVDQIYDETVILIGFHNNHKIKHTVHKNRILKTLRD